MNARSRTSAIDSAAAGPTSTGRWMALVAALAAGHFGRVLAAVGTLQTAPLMALFGGSFAMAGTVLSSIYLLGLAVILFAPATTGLAAAPHAQSPE